MEDTRWQIAKRIFAKATSIPQERRGEWLEAECEDEGLRLELLELLAAHDDAEPGNGAPPEVPPAEGPGVVIDRYKLLQQIGEGGFGTVYMAAQTEPVERRVALKIIKAGMDSGQVIARFEAERQALALMDHPNIAKVLDAGTTASSRPYFVMELVKGVPITEYCNQHDLGPKRRLELFIRVCRAVQHAHQKGIIHRDLKPSNVLVAEYDNTAVPKIIDFGVAKATNQRLTAKTVFTEFGQLVGTFEYMSPEQAKLNQLDIDTRSDVYSLGVLLYELLTGTTPIARERLRSAAFDELLRIIREEEPQKPSTRVSTMAPVPSPPSSRFADPKKLSRRLRGDLDWVVMCALDKERNRRYQSAGDFADDVERHLRGEGVAAGAPSATYRLRKFVRRHRGPVAAVCALVLVLVLGLAGTAFGLVEAEAARDEVVAARDLERHQTFRMSMENGLRLCDEGQVGHGMLWLARALEIAPPGEAAMRSVIRRNLSAWRRQLNSIEMVYPHDATVISVAFDPRGDVVATGSADHTARLWEAATGRPLGEPLAHRGDVHDVTFDSSGSRLLTTTLDTMAHVWDAGTGERLLSLGSEQTPLRILAGGMPAGAFRHPADEQIVTGLGDGTVRIWDAADGNEIGRLKHGEHQVHDVAISADGTRLLTACHDGTAKLWDLDKRELLATFRMGASARGSSVDFVGTDEARIVTGDGAGNAYLWNVAAALADEDHTLEVSAGEFEQLWKHAGNVHGLHVGPDRTRIVTGSFDATARILIPGQAAETRLEHPAPVQNAVFHPDGVRVATASNDGMARLWRPAAGASVRRRAYPLGPVQEATYSADGGYLLTKPDEETAVVRDTWSGEVLCKLAHPGAIRAVAVSRDRSRVFTGSADSVTRLFDADAGKLLGEHEHQGSGIWTVAFSPNDERTLMGDFDGTLEMRDARNGHEVVKGPLDLGFRIQGVAFNDDGSQIIVAGDNAWAQIYGANDWSSPRKFAKHVSTVSVAKYSSDGKHLVTGSFDKTARVWDVATGRPLSDPLRHGSPIFFVAVALSRDGRYVLAGSNDGTARLWDVASSKPIGPALDHDGAVFATAFTDDGRILTGTATATISVWDIDSSPLEGEVERIRLWLEVATGFELNAKKGAFVGLDAATWKRRHARLEALGGPPNATR